MEAEWWWRYGGGGNQFYCPILPAVWKKNGGGGQPFFFFGKRQRPAENFVAGGRERDSLPRGGGGVRQLAGSAFLCFYIKKERQTNTLFSLSTTSWFFFPAQKKTHRFFLAENRGGGLRSVEYCRLLLRR